MSFRLISVIVWLISVILVAYGLGVAIISLIADVGSFPLIGPLLSRPYVIDRIPPILILALFGWVLFALAVKRGEVQRQHTAIATFQTQMAEADQNKYQPRAFDLRQPRGIRRADLIIECSRREPSSLHEAVPAAAVLDAATLTASYGPLNVYAWVLPVLGFIGTASGMASAIAGFADVLRGSVQVDTLHLQSELSQSVIPGLATAFETTILALSAALVAYLCTNALKIWDQEALDQLDRLCIVLLSRIPQPPTPDGQKLLAVLEHIADQIQGVLQVPISLETAAKAIDASAISLAQSSNQFVPAISSIDAAAEALLSASSQTMAAAKAMRDTAEAFDPQSNSEQEVNAKKNKTADGLATAIKELQEAVLRPITIKMSRD